MPSRGWLTDGDLPDGLIAGAAILIAGALVGGIVLVIVGIHMHHTWAGMSSQCNSGLGQFGQALNPEAQSMCHHASTRVDLSWALIIGGALLGGFGLKNLWLPFAAFGLKDSTPGVRSAPLVPRKRYPTPGRFWCNEKGCRLYAVSVDTESCAACGRPTASKP